MTGTDKNIKDGLQYTTAPGPTPLSGLSPLNLFLKEHVIEWDAFCKAYLTPAASNEDGADFAVEIKNKTFTAMGNRVMGDTVEVYRPGNRYTDLELLLDLAFNCKTFKEFLRKHLDPADDIAKPAFIEYPAQLHMAGNDPDAGPDAAAMFLKRSRSGWTDRADYRQLVARLQFACKSLSYFVVYQPEDVREQYTPMLRAVEAALLEKWLDFRATEVSQHPFMEGLPISASTTKDLKSEPKRTMRAEILGTTQGHFAYSILTHLFASKCRTSLLGNINNFRYKCSGATAVKPDIHEAADFLFQEYHHILQAALFTYDSTYAETHADEAGIPSQQADFYTHLSNKLKFALIANAVKSYRMDKGYTGRRMNEKNGMVRRTVSLDALLEDKNSDPALTALHEPTEYMQDDVMAKRIIEMIKEMDPREQAILRARFGTEGEIRSLSDIGNEYAISKERVRQIEGSATKKILSACRKLGITDNTLSDRRR